MQLERQNSLARGFESAISIKEVEYFAVFVYMHVQVSI